MQHGSAAPATPCPDSGQTPLQDIRDSRVLITDLGGVQDRGARARHQRRHVQVLPENVVQARRQEVGHAAAGRRHWRVRRESRLRLAEVWRAQDARRVVYLRQAVRGVDCRWLMADDTC